MEGVAVTYEALSRAVEAGGKEFVYAPDGGRIALMSAQTADTSYAPLPGGDTAMYESGSLTYYRHVDWQGSARLDSTPGQGLCAATTLTDPLGLESSQRELNSNGVCVFVTESGPQTPPPQADCTDWTCDPGQRQIYCYLTGDCPSYTPPPDGPGGSGPGGSGGGGAPGKSPAGVPKNGEPAPPGNLPPEGVNQGVQQLISAAVQEWANCVGKNVGSDAIA